MGKTMDRSELQGQLPQRSARPKKFTDANIRQIINLVERGTSPADIAEIIGVTLGTLKTTCSKLQISLRRPTFDNGAKLLHRPARQLSPSPSVVTPPAPCALRDRNLREQKIADAANTERLEKPATTCSNYGRTAMTSIVMQYKGRTHTAELSLSQELIAHLAIEAQFRGVTLAHLIAQIVESVVESDHFDLLLGRIPEHCCPANSRIDSIG